MAKKRELPAGTYIKYRHLHSGNSSKRKRHGAPMMTVATIHDADGTPLVQAVAECSRKDAPRRDLGRQISSGRALKLFDEMFGGA